MLLTFQECWEIFLCQVVKFLPSSCFIVLSGSLADCCMSVYIMRTEEAVVQLRLNKGHLKSVLENYFRRGCLTDFWPSGPGIAEHCGYKEFFWLFVWGPHLLVRRDHTWLAQGMPSPTNLLFQPWLWGIILTQDTKLAANQLLYEPRGDYKKIPLYERHVSLKCHSHQSPSTITSSFMHSNFWWNCKSSTTSL